MESDSHDFLSDALNKYATKTPLSPNAALPEQR